MYRWIITLLMLAALLFPLTAAAGTVPRAADSIAAFLVRERISSGTPFRRLSPG